MNRPHLLSEQYGKSRQSVTMTSTFQATTGHVVRVTVTNDSYREQSSARAEVLTPALTWTPLTYEPVERWHETSVPSMHKVGGGDALESGLRVLCQELAARAQMLLHAHADGLKAPRARPREKTSRPDPGVAWMEGH